MNVFKFRVIIDIEEDVFRDIEILTTSTFEELHQAILRAFDWEEGEMASFYKSNDMWERGLEIPLMDMGNIAFEEDEKSETPDLGELDDEDMAEMDKFKSDAPLVSMSGLKLNDIVARPDEKLVYVYDFLRMWCFYIELQTVTKAAPSTIYPRVSMVYGDAPAFESKEMDFLGDLDLMASDADSTPELTGDPEIDEFLQEEGGDDQSFESLDDLGDEYV